MVKTLRVSEFGKEYLLTTEDGRLIQKTVFDLDYLRETFGCELGRILDASRMYIHLSPFLPEVYKSKMVNNTIEILSSHFE